jgi:hypothetical protein
MTVANEHLLNENDQSQTYADLVQRLGGGLG